MNRIKELRKLKGLTQEKMCTFLNVTQGNLSAWETERWQPDQQSLIKIADYFNVSVDYLLGRDEQKKLPDGFPPSSQFDKDLKKIGFSIDTYNSMTKEEQQTLLTTLEALIEKFAQNKK